MKSITISPLIKPILVIIATLFIAIILTTNMGEEPQQSETSITEDITVNTELTKLAEIYTTEDIFYIRHDIDKDTYILSSEKQGRIGDFLDEEHIGIYITNEIVLTNSNNPLD